jgi:hypothetical protein
VRSVIALSGNIRASLLLCSISNKKAWNSVPGFFIPTFPKMADISSLREADC